MKFQVRFLTPAIAAWTGVFVLPAMASENVPHTPFAEWAEVPARGELIARLTYQESEAYRFWAGTTRYQSDYRFRGEHYGIDITQGFVSLQYGLTERWAADLALGYTTAGWRFFSDDGSSQSTSGLMDAAFGLRYQIFSEDPDGARPWLPTLT